jgi:hypothetical protein
MSNDDNGTRDKRRPDKSSIAVVSIGALTQVVANDLGTPIESQFADFKFAVFVAFCGAGNFLERDIRPNSILKAADAAPATNASAGLPYALNSPATGSHDN